jgi:[ribosomal protein S5]-alanine N-acetyltransferase
MPLPFLTTEMITLETLRLTLRPFRSEDLDALVNLMANSDFMRFSSGIRTREQTAEFLEKVIGWERDGLPSQFAVVDRATVEITGCGDAIPARTTLLGYCGFFHHPEVPNEIEIGYRLHPDYWNRGIATEAARAVRDHGFRDLELPRVISLIHPENIASRCVAKKVGLRFERNTVFKGFPTQVFAQTRQQWLTINVA